MVASQQHKLGGHSTISDTSIYEICLNQSPSVECLSTGELKQCSCWQINYFLPHTIVEATYPPRQKLEEFKWDMQRLIRKDTKIEKILDLTI